MHHTKLNKAAKKAVPKQKIAKRPLKTAKRTLTTKRTAESSQPKQQAVQAALTVTKCALSTVSTASPIAKKNILTQFSQMKPLVMRSITTMSLRGFRGAPQRLQGTVKWFDPAKGFGFVTTPDGSDLFCHFTSINSNGYRTLIEGQTVEFSIGSTAKGPAAVDVVPFAKETMDQNSI
jgi:CspA family cold shock protein